MNRITALSLVLTASLTVPAVQGSPCPSGQYLGYTWHDISRYTWEVSDNWTELVPCLWQRGHHWKCTRTRSRDWYCYKSKDEMAKGVGGTYCGYSDKHEIVAQGELVTWEYKWGCRQPPVNPIPPPPADVLHARWQNTAEPLAMDESNSSMGAIVYASAARAMDASSKLTSPIQANYAAASAGYSEAGTLFRRLAAFWMELYEGGPPPDPFEDALDKVGNGLLGIASRLQSVQINDPNPFFLTAAGYAAMAMHPSMAGEPAYEPGKPLLLEAARQMQSAGNRVIGGLATEEEHFFFLDALEAARTALRGYAVSIAEALEALATPNTLPELACGDVNADGVVDVSDPVRILVFLFSGGPPPVCVEKPDSPIPMDSITTVAQLESYPTQSLLDTLGNLRTSKQYDLEHGGQFQDYFRCKILLVKTALRQDGVAVEDQPIDGTANLAIAGCGNLPAPDPAPPSSCADVNGDGVVDVSDPVRILAFLFSGGLPLACVSP